MIGEEESFFQGHPELFEGTEHGDVLRYAEVVDRLSREQLGRGIVIRDEGQSTTRVTQTTGGFEVQGQHGPKSETLAGYVLPLNEDNTKHLLVFKTGDLLAIEPVQPTDEVNVNQYRKKFAPSEVPLEESRYRSPMLSHVVNTFREFEYTSRVTRSNASKDDEAAFDELFDQAIEVASKKKQNENRYEDIRCIGSWKN